MLYGRTAECATLDRLLLDAKRGRSQVLALRGEPGIGKTALLEYLAERAAGCRVIRAAGVESEMELTLAGLHQLCAPLLDGLGHLPAPQATALATAFGLDTADPADRFLVGLAVLSLLSEAAEDAPVVCVVDDAQWLDQASAQMIGFVARRLLAERIAFVCAARSGIGDEVLAGWPELSVRGLGDDAARALLLEGMRGPVDAAVSQQIITESHGNPLALLELPRTWTAGELGGGFGLLDSSPLAGRIEQSYAQRLLLLPAETRLLVLAAAAEPLGDLPLLQGAAETLGLDMTAAGAAEDAGLLHVGAHVEFSHPLVRSAAYRSASTSDRHRVHQALADATDAGTDPDRRAWHRARATSGPDEHVAAELERSAGRAQARGGVATAAAFLRRSVELTLDPTRRAERALAAAQASLEAGAFEAARATLATVEAWALDELTRARVHLLAGRIASASSFGSAAEQLLRAAQELEPLDVERARETYLDAWGAALAAGALAPHGTLRDISRAARRAPPPGHEPYPSDLLLDGLAQLVTDGLAEAAPALRAAVSAFRHDERVLQWGAMAATGAAALWDMEGFHLVLTRQLQLARDAGALSVLATALQGAGIVVTWTGDFRKAASLTAEADAVCTATGIRISPYGGMLLHALRGREAEAPILFETTVRDATASGEGLGIQYAHWATAILCNGLGRYEEALVAAQQASDDAPELFVSHWALAELVEAAVRSQHDGLAAEAAQRLIDATSPSGADWGLGVAARARALTDEGEAAQASYLEAIARLRRTPLRPELGRAHLLYGEWLRRESRRIEAREQLRTAHDMFVAIGMEAFAERARRELLATGETARKRNPEMRDELTPQEEQIARLARDGLSNPAIGAQLYLSRRTVEWHLHNVFIKLGITSRKGLHAALRDSADELIPA
jgi:DNA-binding CsgD family transcriptional regulator/tetratricopeptide (TPR) repeat protein